MDPRPKILFLDIETKPAVIASFGIRDQHITHNQILKDGGTICVGVKWRNKSKVTVFSDWEHGHETMLREVHAMLSEADAVATYNGARFDIPKLMGEFLLAGMEPPPPPTQIDIFQTVRKLGLISSKLDYIAPLLGVGGKLKHEGLAMWLAVMDGDPKAQSKMARYCAQDVRLLEQVYDRVRPYISTHPHLAETKRDQCGACGSSRLQARGFYRTKASIAQRYACQACGSWSLGRREKAA